MGSSARNRASSLLHPLLDTWPQPGQLLGLLHMLDVTRMWERDGKRGTGGKHCASLSNHSCIESNRPVGETFRKPEVSFLFIWTGLLAACFYSVRRQNVGILHMLTDVKFKHSHCTTVCL